MTHQELMDQYRTLDKTTLSFLDFKKKVQEYLQRSDELSGTGFAQAFKEYESMLEGEYHEGCSVLVMGVTIQYGM